MSLDPRTTPNEFKWCGDFWFTIQMINEKIINKFYFSISVCLSLCLSLSHSLSLFLSLSHTQTHTLYICIQVLQYNQFIVLKNNTFVWLCIFINRCRDNRVHVKEGKKTDIVYICWDWWCSNQHNSLKVILILFCLLLCIWMKIIRTSLIMGFICIIT